MTAVCTHRYPPPSCHHIVLREGGSFYTDVGKITHEAMTHLHNGSVVEIGRDPVSCQVLFHKTRRDDFVDFRFGDKAKRSRRFVHPNDLQTLSSILDIQSGSRVLECGVSYGHLTLLLSDLVGDSGHVIASSKNPVHEGLQGVITEWLNRDRMAEDRRGERYTNVTLHSFDIADRSEAMLSISSALSHKHLVEDMDSFSPQLETLKEPQNRHPRICSSSFAPFLLDSATVVKMPEGAALAVVESVVPLLKLGGAIGVIPLEFRHLRSLANFVHERRLPLFLELVRGPESHDLFHCLDEAETSLVGKDGHTDDIDLELDEMADETTSSDSRRPRIVGKGLCMPKDFQKLALYRPHKRLFWSKRRYEPVWIAKLVKVSSFKFVAGAEIEISDESRKRQIEEQRAKLERELQEKFVLTREMEDKIERQRQILRTEVERQNAENGRVDRLKLERVLKEEMERQGN